MTASRKGLSSCVFCSSKTIKALNQSLATQLEKAGYAVDRAEDGREGLYYAQEYPIDLAIVDLGLPTVSGVELIKHGARGRQGVSDPRAHGARPLARQSRSAEARRRRLRREAVPRRGAARARRRAAAARERLGAVGARLRADHARHAHAGSEGRRPEARAHELRVQAARVPDAARGRGVVEDADHRGALRRGLRARQQRDRGVHRAAAQEARSRSPSTSRSKRCAAEAIASRSRAGLPIPPDSCQSSDAWPSFALFVRASFSG